MSNDKSKKRKTDEINRKELWNVFDSEIKNPNKQTDPLECIYRSSGNREMCERCEHMLAFSDEGFLTCTNNKCGIIYKDLVDQSAEWRYYGADDNQNSDPTRCGMPINPLLQ
jgi:transcription initiation factor TFIIB